jgi:hypothetical protein
VCFKTEAAMSEMDYRYNRHIDSRDFVHTRALSALSMQVEYMFQKKDTLTPLLNKILVLSEL